MENEKELINKLNNSIKLSEEEVKYLINNHEYNNIHIETYRWTENVKFIIEFNNSFYTLYAHIGLTEYQESFYESQIAYEVKPVKKVIATTDWILKKEPTPKNMIYLLWETGPDYEEVVGCSLDLDIITSLEKKLIKKYELSIPVDDFIAAQDFWLNLIWSEIVGRNREESIEKFKNKFPDYNIDAFYQDLENSKKSLFIEEKELI